MVPRTAKTTPLRIATSDGPSEGPDDLCALGNPAPVGPGHDDDDMDIGALRVQTSFSGAPDGLPLVMQLRKPRKGEFFRARPGYTMVFTVLELPGRELYVVDPRIVEPLDNLVRNRVLTACVNRVGEPFIYPTAHVVDVTSDNSWNVSGARALDLAFREWVRVGSDRRLQSYVASRAPADSPLALQEPEWPDLPDFHAWLKLALRGRVLRDLQHPVVAEALGQL